MKRLSLILVLALVLAVALAGIASAAQVKTDNKAFGDYYTYKSTPKVVYSDSTGWGSTFNGDNQSKYPYEIYLPNEAAPGSYRVHTNYSENTDACASCHSTHTGVGEALLQWATIHDTCMACHDGTVSTTYNVEEGNFAVTRATYGGAFGYSSGSSDYGLSQSSHNVSGELGIAAAPGGSATADGKKWTGEFGCESCHTPHGQGGNARILNPNPNNVVAAAWSDVVGADGILKIASVAKMSMTGRGYDLYIDTDTDWDGNETKISATSIDNSLGYTKVTDANAVGKYVYLYPTVRVAMKVTGYLTADETITHKSGMNDFCGACHTDYNTASVTSPHANENGTYSEAYRHKVGRTTSSSSKAEVINSNMVFEVLDGKSYIECLTCHVAHGVNKNYWVKTIGSAGSNRFADDQLTEIAGSSALKRVPNMGTCEACHDKSTANIGYLANTEQTINTSAATTTAMTAGGGFAGSDSCANCHNEAYKEYQETWHPNKTRPGVSEEVFKAAQHASAISYKGVDLKQLIIDTQTELAKVITNANGTKNYDPVNPDNIKVWSWGKDASRIAIRGSVYYPGDATKEDQWFTFAASEVDHETEEIEFITQNVSQYTCFNACHTTGYAEKYGASTNSANLTTGWLEKVTAGQKPDFDLGVTCESCHGEAGNHVKYPTRKNIVNPGTLSPTIQTVGIGTVTVPTASSVVLSNPYMVAGNSAKSCGACHNSITHQADFFAPGLEYNDHGTKYSPTQYATTNKHFASGLVGCNSCHVMHRESATHGQLRTQSDDELCESCHGQVLDINTYMPLLPGNPENRQHDFTGPIANAKPVRN